MCSIVSTLGSGRVRIENRICHPRGEHHLLPVLRVSNEATAPVYASSLREIASYIVGYVSRATILARFCIFQDKGSAEDEAEALRRIRELRESGWIVGFDEGRRLPKRNYSLSDLRLHKIDASKLLTPKDDTLSRLKAYASLAYIAGLSTGIMTDIINISSASAIVIVTGLLIGVDQVPAPLSHANRPPYLFYCSFRLKQGEAWNFC